jgi:hypothetical protein
MMISTSQSELNKSTSKMISTTWTEDSRNSNMCSGWIISEIPTAPEPGIYS